MTTITLTCSETPEWWGIEVGGWGGRGCRDSVGVGDGVFRRYLGAGCRMRFAQMMQKRSEDDELDVAAGFYVHDVIMPITLEAPSSEPMLLL